MARVVHFEIQASNPSTLIAFYRELFGWQFSQWGEQQYWIIRTGEPGQPGIDGGLLQRRGPAPAEGQAVNCFVCTVQVESLDDTVNRALSRGAAIAVPRMPIPGLGWLGYIKDPDGNILGLMQPDPRAA